MKILSFHISKSRLVGVIYHKGFIESQFDLLLQDYTPLFFQKMGLNLQEYYLCYTICDSSVLCKESFLTKVPQNAIKKLIPFYESSLFPLDDKDTCLVTFYEKIKKSYHLCSHAIVKDTLNALLDELKSLSLLPDALFSWQKALEKSLSHLLDPQKESLIFYFYADVLYILHKKDGHIATSTSIKILPKNPSLSPILASLKQQLGTNPYDVFYIGDHEGLEKQLQSTFNDSLIMPKLNVKPHHLMHQGACLLAEKNKYNLLKNFSFNKMPPLSLMKKTLLKINLIASVSALLLSAFIFGKQLYQENKSSHDPHISIEQSLEAIDKLKVLHTIAIEAPSPLDIMAYLSTHPVLNKMENRSSLSTSFSSLKYELLSPQKAKVILSLTFPQESLKLEFEKHLTLKKIPFTCINRPHTTNYELEFTKNNLY